MPDMDFPSYVYSIVKVNEITLTELMERYDGSGRQKELH